MCATKSQSLQASGDKKEEDGPGAGQTGATELAAKDDLEQQKQQQEGKDDEQADTNDLDDKVNDMDKDQVCISVMLSSTYLIDTDCICQYRKCVA